MTAMAFQPQWDEQKKLSAQTKCAAFLEAQPEKRFVMGRNVYAQAVAGALDVAGFVDDFTADTHFAGLPVVKTDALPADAMVLAVSGGRPQTVRSLLDARQIANVDYFAFQRWSGLSLPEAVFNEDFPAIFDRDREKINWLFGRLADAESQSILSKLLHFRYSYDLDYLDGFQERQTEQYFEPFFRMSGGKPVFVDVGGFDGFTSAEFIRFTPDYHAVYIFEPDAGNRATCEARFAGMKNIHLLPYGAGQEDATLRFSSDGSASSFREDGEIEIDVRRIDDLVTEVPTFIKMDIEGAEHFAIEGARNLIAEHQPVLALAVYHRPSDMWDIPERVLKICPDYKIYLRHYTESIYETVMYFVPPKFEVS